MKDKEKIRNLVVGWTPFVVTGVLAVAAIIFLPFAWHNFLDVQAEAIKEIPVQMAGIISLAAIVITASICVTIIMMACLRQARTSLRQDLDSEIIRHMLEGRGVSTSGNNTPEGQA